MFWCHSPFFCMHSCEPCMTTWIKHHETLTLLPHIVISQENQVSRLEKTPGSNPEFPRYSLWSGWSWTSHCWCRQNNTCFFAAPKWNFNRNVTELVFLLGIAKKGVESSVERGHHFGITLPVWNHHIGNDDPETSWAPCHRCRLKIVATFVTCARRKKVHLWAGCPISSKPN